MSTLFHKVVSDEDALRLFSLVGLTSLHDCRWFCKSDFTSALLQKMQEELVYIEPYYIAKKKFVCYREMTPQRIICILRHIAKSKQMWIEKKEKFRYGQKETFYRLRAGEIPNLCNYVVTFD